MKRIMVLTCVFVISLFLTACQNKATNAVEKEYTSKFRQIHFDLRTKRLDLLGIMRERQLDLAYGRSSKEQDAKNEETRIREEISKLEQDRDNLKLDAAKYYKGKLPKSLEEEWREITADYDKFYETVYEPEFDKIYEESKKKYEESKKINEESMRKK